MYIYIITVLLLFSDIKFYSSDTSYIFLKPINIMNCDFLSYIVEPTRL